MPSFQFLKTLTCALSLLFILSACTSTTVREAEKYAANRADKLETIIPVNMNGYNLIRAKAVKSQIELTLLYSGQEGVLEPKVLASNLTSAYCGNEQIRSMIDKGVQYRLLFRDTRGRAVFDHKVTNISCKTS